MKLYGHSTYGPTAHDSSQETTYWIGKPWRRLELLIQRVFWKDECIDTTWTASATLGLRRLGWHFHGSLTRQLGADYSDEENQ